MSRPSELVIALAAYAVAAEQSYRDGWVYADQIAFRLRIYGFDGASSQRVASWVKPMCACDAPWLERQRDYSNIWGYRVTRYGRNDIENKLHVRARALVV